MPFKSSAGRYGSVAITIHWLSAATILLLLFLGFRAASASDPAAKAAILRLHVPLGLFILALTVLRLAWWIFDRKPPRAAATPRWQRITERAVHTLFYVVILMMAGSGIGMMALSGGASILFGGSSRPLPNFWTYAPHVPHSLGAFALLGLTTVHVAAALYHQFIKRDRLLARMGVGHGVAPDGGLLEHKL